MSVYIIAEAGVNHNGSLDMALKLIDCASEAGADAVKFQTFRAEKVISEYAPKAEYQTLATGKNQSQLEMVRPLELGAEAHYALKKRCNERKINFLSTPFDEDSVDFLAHSLGLRTLKIPSGEITNAPLLLRAARTGCSIIMSTGMSTLGEIEEALGVLAFGFLNNETPPSRDAFCKAFFSKEGQNVLKQRVSLLHCTTEYPAPFSEVNLRVLETLRQAFGLPVGYSDHTEGIAVPIAAAALGASIIEKHFTLDKGLPGPDHKASLEPDELSIMVYSIRKVEDALGDGKKIPTFSELKNQSIARKSLVAKQEISQGVPFSENNITAKRPGDGISPMLFWDLIGKKASRYFLKDEKIQ
ncbi:N-acetylneuraminate synthase [Aminivibrio sp.]|uniref:N-acetylneuraminate synthase n=1 Tax=Aminivibrio sp. TaxID=1872489 RepID=UPI001A485973|nr:N-acetylneuraminate synthase [Aminivibrio sp.]MBL3539453.1 N-acetylneuraminate synthase [Aminivibrio sp.]